MHPTFFFLSLRLTLSKDKGHTWTQHILQWETECKIIWKKRILQKSNFLRQSEKI
jgi:hypothetical protein